MPAIVINGNDFKKASDALNRVGMYKCQKPGVFQKNRFKPRTSPIYNYIKKLLNQILSFEVKNPPEELNNVLKNLNKSTLVNLKNEKKSYEREKEEDPANFKVKVNYVKFLRNTTKELKELAKVVGAEKIEKSTDNIIKDCDSIKGIDNSENPFSTLSQTFKNFKEKAKKYLYPMDRKIYARECKTVGTIGIGKASKILDKYGEWFQAGNYDSIKEDYNENFVKKNLSLTNAIIPITQLAGRQKLFAEEFVKIIDKLIKLPDKINENREELIHKIDEAKRYTLFGFDGKFEDILSIAEKALHYVIDAKEIPEENNAENSSPDVREMISKINKNNADKGFFVGKKRQVQSPNSHQSHSQVNDLKKLLEECCDKEKKLCENISGDLKKFNSNISLNVNEQGIAVTQLLEVF